MSLLAKSSYTTLQDIESVDMKHLSAALEFNLYETDKETPLNIINATYPYLIYKFKFDKEPTVTYMFNNFNISGDKYELYVTQEAYNYLKNKKYGSGNFTLTVK